MVRRKIIIVAGARPNFMKIAPIIKELDKRSDFFEYCLVHTGQHYDDKMSGSFFRELSIPEPDINLGISGGTPVEQTARIMIEFEGVLKKELPDLVLVIGDVNSTAACAYCAKQNKIPLAHVEAGLRSEDRNMPEEINRLVTDAISDYFFVSEKSGMDNLTIRGTPREKLFYVGNVMIDNLVQNLDKFNVASVSIQGLRKGEYCIVTIHRPSNVDNKKQLLKVYNIINEVSKRIKVVWPIHPRTKKNIEKFELKAKFDSLDSVEYSEPLGYVEFMSLVKDAKLVLTDSGGIQEETTFLKIPCITLRDNTERPSTIESNGNVLIGINKGRVMTEFYNIVDGEKKNIIIPPYWDGKASERIVDAFSRIL